MSYVRFALMILTSTVVMFILMYLNTYAFEHVYFSETRTYMAIVMGATMAIIMLAFMLGMYKNRALNIAIFVGSAVVFAGALWLVRSQVTVSGESYMRAMIPHHSIAIMTSERAQIEDARVRKLADEISAAQRREIAEMAYLIEDLDDGNVVREVYTDPAPEPGTVEDALNRVQIASLDLAPMPEDEANEVLQAGERCTFRRSQESEPILWTTGDGAGAAAKLNGVLLSLEGNEGRADAAEEFASDGITITVGPFDEDDDPRKEAELVFELSEGLRVGYTGYYACSS
ncbi:DUF305 domain-containing protein [Nitratireductor basaltis]|uniref:DUF305 domain-containing protein n=1 Tax=Nitratireductor basaltis TaxID=472175 RepID=A0A084U8I5_9HYPH|nr:DUF305 domain-containing protein [Nitratireductor basaltis]KFB09271.1 hypothetical protein EL18_00286 [Nitratireductor basaltis]